jgi:putative transposase
MGRSVKTYRANTYRLYPTADQARTMERTVGACRFIFNLALEQRRDWWRQHLAVTGRHICYAGQCKELTALRAEVSWLSEISVHALQQALRDLDRAFTRYFTGVSRYPSFRRKGESESYRLVDARYLVVQRTGKSSGQIKLPKLGWVRLRGWRSLPGPIVNVTVRKTAGHWHAAVQCSIAAEAPSTHKPSAVGMDLGVVEFSALSDGSAISSLHIGRKLSSKLRREQRSLSRKKRGSANWRKAAKRLARVHAHIAAARKDFLHKSSTAIAKNHGIVVVESLRVNGMTRSARGTASEPGRNVRQKAGLNRSILDQGWGRFRQMLEYKLADRGGRLIQVPPAYTSQTCSRCSHIDKRSRVSRSKFQCTQCGFSANADTNAAVNILRRADLPVEACGGEPSKRPVEAGSAGVKTGSVTDRMTRMSKGGSPCPVTS